MIPKEYYLEEPADYNQATTTYQIQTLLDVFTVQELADDSNYLGRCFRTVEEKEIAHDIYKYIIDTENTYDVYENKEKFIKQFIRCLLEAGYF